MMFIPHLIEAGSDVNAKNDEGRTAIHFVSSERSLQHLVRAGIDINAVNMFGETAIHINSDETEDNLIFALVEEGIDINAKDGDGMTAVGYAIKYLSDDYIQKRIRAGKSENDCIQKYIDAGCKLEKHEWQNQLVINALAENASRRAGIRVALEEIGFEDFTNITELLDFLFRTPN